MALRVDLSNLSCAGCRATVRRIRTIPPLPVLYEASLVGEASCGRYMDVPQLPFLVLTGPSSLLAKQGEIGGVERGWMRGEGAGDLRKPL